MPVTYSFRVIRGNHHGPGAAAALADDGSVNVANGNDTISLS